MKLQFGNMFSRLWRNGTISELEREILSTLVFSLLPALRVVVEAQFAAYNLVQREVDGRALNFYRATAFGLTHAGVPMLEHKGMEAPLVRIAFSVDGDNDPLHAVLTAVNGRTFCVSLNRPAPVGLSASALSVQHVTNAWRANFRVADA